MSLRPACALQRADPRVVHRHLRGADRRAGRGVVGHRRRRQHAGHRADRVRQDAGRVPVGHRPAGLVGAHGRARAGHPGAVRVAAEGAGRRRRAQPAHPADRHRPDRRAPRCARTGHQRRRALRRHPARTAPRADHQAARHPDHHAGVAVPDADLGGARDAGRGADGHRRRGARRRGHQTRRAPGAVAGAARPAVGHARPAHRAVGDRAAARGSGAVPVRAGADDDRRAARGQDVRPVGAGAGPGHGEPGEQHHLARRRGTHRRPDRGAPQLDRVRQLATAGRATHLTAQRDSRRAVGHRTAGGPQPAGRRRLAGAASWPAASPSGAEPLLARAHHGSVSKEQRALVEDDLKSGRLRPSSPPPAWNWASTWARSIW